jgi:hypothetical protein
MTDLLTTEEKVMYLEKLVEIQQKQIANLEQGLSAIAKALIQEVV